MEGLMDGVNDIMIENLQLAYSIVEVMFLNNYE